ncbi:targeting protein for Xklp2 [Takifugu rubripes]|uniref:TPX2 microtubule nucleation factor n=1 Tax=Takifugu rubripes TaxID=31033 RepID=H2TEZ2_TAKRU|nr:targeting protein for Xklp2 [Takifugu rubripes]|eukprot:XP_011619069.1 PREDICTED: targeting protein for Xklp2 [Takifugu rubripes]
MAESNFDADAELYEYDAPSEVVDLKELQDVEGDDKWFEEQALGVDKHLSTPLRPDQVYTKGDVVELPIAIVCPQVEADADPGPSSSLPALPNVVTSWGDAPASQAGTRPKRKTANYSSAQPCRVFKRKSQASVPAAPPLKKHKSSEEEELERIRNLQKEVALQRKKNEASYKAALAGNLLPEKRVLAVTIPKEFHFKTNNQSKDTTSSNTSQKESDFVLQLRKPTTSTKTTRGATVPKPFNLSRGTKRKVDETSTYVPMAQLIEQFERRTPERYHLRSRKNQDKGPSPVKGDHLKLTQPHTPHLVTKQRSRPPTIKGQAELEAEELNRLKNYKFKALELNKKIIEGAEALKKPPVKDPTVPEGFELQIEKRLQKRQTSKPLDEEKPHNFKSHPLPKKILEGVVGLPEKKVLPPTVPESPAFALKKRVHREPAVEVKPPPHKKAPSVPHFGLPFQPQLPQNRHVEVCPFSFEEREQERRVLKEKKLEDKRLEESQVPQFKAQLLPNFDTVVLPEKKKLEATKPEPFRMLIDQRGAVRSTRLEQMVNEEQKQLKEITVFKAKPNIVTHKEPFQPRKESRIAVVPDAFELSTERRARDRQEYERTAMEKEAIRAMMEEEHKREEEQREKEEIARLRQEQVHKAQPVKHYKPVSLKKSEVPLTVPQSPNFSDRFRL